MKNTDSPLFPANFVAFPAFITLLCYILEESDWEMEDLALPWIALSDEKKVKEFRKEDDTYNTYVSLLESVIQYIGIILPDTEVKIDALSKRRQDLIKENNYEDTDETTDIINQIKQLQSTQPQVQWFYRAEKYNGVGLNETIKERDNEFLTSLLIWLLMVTKRITPDQYNGRLQFLPLDNFDAWRPMFEIHRISNKILCKLTTFGHKLVDCQDYEKGTMTSYNVDDSYAEGFECFFRDKDNNILSLDSWFSKLRYWGYERQAAREFFDVNGFLSNIYSEAMLGVDDKKRFALFVKHVVLPEFDVQWPVK